EYSRNFFAQHPPLNAYLLRRVTRGTKAPWGLVAVPPIVALSVCASAFRESGQQQDATTNTKSLMIPSKEKTRGVQMQQVGSDPTLAGIERQALERGNAFSMFTVQCSLFNCHRRYLFHFLNIKKC